ncbi:MAG: LysM peptidoglycan-binding domain-containing protein [Anaerolineaceae bacterium]|nr:LysM peptidoglycan-binding domain-containing protein [Anaerolineaceae bacterium]
MGKRRSKLWILIVLVVFIAICLAIVAVFYSFQRASSFNARPLVLIHNPLNRDELMVGEGIIVHATGRSQRGVEHIELWVDNVLLTQKEAGDQPASPLVLTADWVPTSTGTHLIVVRAVSADGISGQSSIGVTVVESGEVGGVVHTVEEGETLAEIAEEYGTTLEELEELNPGLDPGGPAPGDDVEVPDEEPPRAAGGEGEEEVSAEDDEPPAPEAESPADSDSVVEEVSDWFGHPEEGMIGLQVEVLSLLTSSDLEGLHCYIGFAGAPPLWFPDADNDQTSDESFSILENIADLSSWDVEPYLRSDSTPIIFWPENDPLPFEIACVGVAGGGTQALDLGRAQFTIAPQYWNGIDNGYGTSGADGRFQFIYRVNIVGDRPRNVPMFLDPDMTSPTNARIDDRRISLRWDYEPEADEIPIDGFRVYLNGNLQWVEAPDARESGLPYEWLNPPCGTRYALSVTAFRYGFPDGPESFPSLAFTETPAENCNREIQISFLTLETFDLGGDGNHEDRHGDIGPPYGYFFANERQITFDARPSSGGGGSLDMPNGLTDNTTYDLMSMYADPSWDYSGMPSTIVDVPEGGSFEFGFHIMDQDNGRCGNSDDRGCDDLICEGLSMIYTDSGLGTFDQYHEGALESDDGRCRVTYTFGPAFGSPVGTGGEGWEPLPWIQVEDIVIDEATGQMEVYVRNTGTATWPWRDLTIRLQTRDGDPISTITWPGYVLEAGQRDVLVDLGMVLEAPFDACVVIDPDDEVLEEYERSGAMVHGPICPRLPDLTITDVSFEPAGGGRIRITVRNDGDGAVENRTLAFQTLLPDGESLYIGGSYPNVDLALREERFFELGGVSESVRERMRRGYSVVVNPDATIAESNMDNNTYDVAAGQRLRIYLYGIWAPEDAGDHVRYQFDAHVVSGSSQRQVADWEIGPDISWGSCFPSRYCIRLFQDNEYDTYWFDIYGDESLEIIVNVTHPGGLREAMTGSDIYGPVNNWGSSPPFNYSCRDPQSSSGVHNWNLGYAGVHAWEVTFHICKEEMEP